MRRDEDLELWGRDMDQDDWMRGTYGSGGNVPSRYGRRAWGSEWNRGPDWNRGSDSRQGPNVNRGSSWSAGGDQTPSWQRQGWQGGTSGENYGGPEPWRGDRDWSQEWWHRNAGFGWTGNPWEGRGRQWHGRTTARNYQRSDERIREDVYERLMEHPYIDTTDIDVSVSQGEVTLEGTVPDRWEKRLAEDLTEGVFGVNEVNNRLRTSSASSAQTERGAPVSHASSGQTDRAEAPRPMPASSGWPSS
jgi:BON domain